MKITPAGRIKRVFFTQLFMIIGYILGLHTRHYLYAITSRVLKIPAKRVEFASR